MPTTPLLSLDHTERTGRFALGCALLLLGVVHLVFGADVQRMFLLAEPMPNRDAIARGLAAVLLVGGAFIVSGGRGSVYTRVGALTVALTLLATTAVMHLPAAIASGTFGGRWIGSLKWLALAGGVALVATDRTQVRLAARIAMAALMIGSAVAHLKYTAIVITLMPAWMPAREFWAYFTAATLGLGGVGLLIPKTARLAGLLSAAMFAGFFLLVHIPRTLAAPTMSAGWAELGESLAYAAIALLLAHNSRNAAS
jgi:uncharacterized membrane protein YphA (DoxX/SURF4 family)